MEPPPDLGRTRARGARRPHPDRAGTVVFRGRSLDLRRRARRDHGGDPHIARRVALGVLSGLRRRRFPVSTSFRRGLWRCFSRRAIGRRPTQRWVKAASSTSTRCARTSRIRIDDPSPLLTTRSVVSMSSIRDALARIVPHDQTKPSHAPPAFLALAVPRTLDGRGPSGLEARSTARGDHGPAGVPTRTVRRRGLGARHGQGPRRREPRHPLRPRLDDQARNRGDCARARSDRISAS